MRDKASRGIETDAVSVVPREGFDVGASLVRRRREKCYWVPEAKAVVEVTDPVMIGSLAPVLKTRRRPFRFAS